MWTKIVILSPWRQLSHSDDLNEPQSAYATVTEHTNHRHILFLGGTHPNSDIAEQVQTVLNSVEILIRHTTII